LDSNGLRKEKTSERILLVTSKSGQGSPESINLSTPVSVKKVLLGDIGKDVSGKDSEGVSVLQGGEANQEAFGDDSIGGGASGVKGEGDALP
jgi:hypothetical protein